MPTDETVFRSRVLILAPVGRDTALTRSLLDRAGVETLGCSNLDDLQQNLLEGAGAAVITEEALIGRDTSGLVEWVTQQPSWSDFPFILLLEPGASSQAVGHELDPFHQTRNLPLPQPPPGSPPLATPF